MYTFMFSGDLFFYFSGDSYIIDDFRLGVNMDKLCYRDV